MQEIDKNNLNNLSLEEQIALEVKALSEDEQIEKGLIAYLQGRIIEADVRLDLLVRASENPVSAYLLSYLKYDPYEKTKSVPDGNKLSRRARDLSHKNRAMSENSFAIIFPIIKEYVDNENPKAQSLLGTLYGDRHCAGIDSCQAVELFLKAAEQGDSQAQYHLGHVYYLGLGVQQDEEKAFKWYLKAAEQGEARAQEGLGKLYECSETIGQDHFKAFTWYKLAAEQGLWTAQTKLGQMYENGEGIPRDYRKTAEWYMEAAKNGHLQSQFDLGQMYFEGRGVPKDDAKAVKWWRCAAERGHHEAQLSLGKIYEEEGQGVDQNYSESYYWFYLALLEGDRGKILQKKIDFFEENNFLTDAEIVSLHRKALLKQEELYGPRCTYIRRV